MIPGQAISYQTPACPPPHWIQITTFVQAVQNPYDDSQWNVVSDRRWVNGRFWQVEYGSFFPKAHDQQSALQMAQRAFTQDSQSIFYPRSVPIPNYCLCDYTGNGGLFWVSAASLRGNCKDKK